MDGMILQLEDDCVQTADAAHMLQHRNLDSRPHPECGASCAS